METFSNMNLVDLHQNINLVDVFIDYLYMPVQFNGPHSLMHTIR